MPPAGVPIRPAFGRSSGGTHVLAIGSTGSGLGVAAGSSRSRTPAVDTPSSEPSVRFRPYDALMPSSAVIANTGMASSATSLRHHREYQRFQTATVQAAKTPETHHHVA